VADLETAFQIEGPPPRRRGHERYPSQARGRALKVEVGIGPAGGLRSPDMAKSQEPSGDNSPEHGQSADGPAGHVGRASVWGLSTMAVAGAAVPASIWLDKSGSC
jgi:hypothetical protein